MPNTKIINHTICRNIWNKKINKRISYLFFFKIKDIFIEVIKYIGNYYLNQFVITADDILMNLIVYHFANNYSNIEVPGYLYNIRKISMSHGDGGNKLKINKKYKLFFILSNIL